MKTKLDKLIEQIDPSRTLNEVSSRVDEAVNRFACSIGSINDYNRFEQVLSQFVRHVDNQVLHMPSDFAPSSYDWAKCVRILEKEYGDQGHKVAFEMASTGIAGGLYEVLKRVAYHLAYDFAQNEISARVYFFWNDLSMDEKFAAIDEYANKFGKFLPESYVEGSAVFLKMNFTKVLEEHPRMIKRLRNTIRWAFSNNNCGCKNSS